MPQIDVSGYDQRDAMAIFVAHLLERFDTLNNALLEIAEELRAIRERLSYAQVLDSQD